jgi:hypothetical protein
MLREVLAQVRSCAADVAPLEACFFERLQPAACLQARNMISSDLHPAMGAVHPKSWWAWLCMIMRFPIS